MENSIKEKGFPDSSVGKESACNAGDLGSVPGLESSPGEGKGYPVQYSGLENSRFSPWWYSPWGCKESDMTEGFSFSLSLKRSFLFIIWLSQCSLYGKNTINVILSCSIHCIYLCVYLLSELIDLNVK